MKLNDTIAAKHMVSALQAIYRENTSPNLSIYPSGGVVLNTREADPFGNLALGVTTEELPQATATLSGDFPAAVLSPGDREPDWETLMGASGFAHAASIPAMEADLSPMVASELPDGFTFSRLPSTDNGLEWADTLTRGYPVAPLASQSMSPVHAKMSDSPDADVQFFAVRTGNTIAGISLLVLTDGVAGIYCVATLPEYRRLGIGKALTALPLLVARDLGYKKGVLQASEAGYKVYQSLGFSNSGEVQFYLRMPPEIGQNEG
ncbi:MAG: GNAT family N-acetyltransferase [Armatimonadetes bacterium]|nr:GNAT family N-acetyltransferase [Armatimonadota bacterium]